MLCEAGIGAEFLPPTGHSWASGNNIVAPTQRSPDRSAPLDPHHIASRRGGWRSAAGVCCCCMNTLHSTLLHQTKDWLILPLQRHFSGYNSLERFMHYFTTVRRPLIPATALSLLRAHPAKVGAAEPRGYRDVDRRQA